MRPVASLFTVVVCSLAVGLLQAPAVADAQADRPAWARPDKSVSAKAAVIVDEALQAASGESLELVVTEATAEGPKFRPLKATSRSAAIRAVEAAQKDPDTLAIAEPQVVSAASNDPYRHQQWALDRLNAEAAWNISLGRGVKVAVIDSGIDRQHPDLAGRIGRGINMIGSTAGTGLNDSCGHGTHVAGIIAANANNRIGIAGLAPATTILPVKVLRKLPSGCDGSTADVANGIVWAVNQGAKVINLSIATSGGFPPQIPAAVEYAVSRNVVVVAAAGNDCSVAPVYPAALPHVLGVAAVDEALDSPWYSCGGAWTDLAAPGSNVLSTYLGGGYATVSGTSMATPHVSATAAMLIEQFGPKASASQVRNLLKNPAYLLHRGSAGWNAAYGNGVVQPVQVLKHVGSKLRVTLPKKKKVSGKKVRMTGRLTRQSGEPLANRVIKVKWRKNKKSRVKKTRTNGNGDFAVTFRPRHKVKVKVKAGPAFESGRVILKRPYKRVIPKWNVKKYRKSVRVKVPTAFNQRLALQKKQGKKWRAVSSVRVRKPMVWSPETGRGKWRIKSFGNKKLSTRVSKPWKRR